MKKVIINRTIRNDGTERISGYTMYCDTKITFSVSQSQKKAYPYVLRASVIDPASGMILQSSAKLKAIKNTLSDKELDKLRKGQSIERINAQAMAYLIDTTDEEINKAVEKLAIKLYQEYEEDIKRGLLLTSNKGSLTCAALCKLHSRAFLRSLPKTTEKVLKEKTKNLEKVCAYLSEKPFDHLTVDDLAKVSTKIGKNPLKLIKLFDQFWDYMLDNQCIHRKNIAKEFIKQEKRKKAKKKGLYRPNATHLDKQVEKNLHDILVRKNDEESIAAALVKGYGMSIDRLLRLTWGDLVIEGNELRIPDPKDNFTGATQNYIRPPTRETTELLLQRFQELCELYGVRKTKNMRVVNLPGNTSQIKARLSRAFREMLIEAGVAKADLNSAGCSNPKAPGGAGYTLLRSDYKHKLQHCLGVDPESGTGCFLRGARINDTTNDSYRSFSDATGNHYLQVIMRRDDLGINETNAIQPKIKSSITENDQQLITVPAGAGATRTAVTTRKRILLRAGSEIEFSANDGVEGQVVFFEDETEISNGEFERLL